MNGAAQLEASSSTSHSLLQRVQQHEPAAWDRFAQLYGPLVYRWCRTANLQESDADDVVQEVFRGVFQGIDRFRPQTVGPSLRAWLYGITRNKIRDHFRRLRDEPTVAGGSDGQGIFAQLAELPETDPEPPRTYVAEVSQRALTLIQTEFEQTTWQAFWAMAVDGLPAAEAAARLGLTTAAAFKCKSRVLNRLRRELDGLLE